MGVHRLAALPLLIALFAATAACKSNGDQGAPTISATPSGRASGATSATPRPQLSNMKIESTSFQHQGAIPKKYTCEGDDLSPPIRWSGLPEGTKSLALIVDDPDAPDPAKPKMTWVHWVLYDLPPTSTGIAEAAKQLPEGTRQGNNDWKRTKFGGPCPPIGRHRYFHKLYALDAMLGDLAEPTKAKLEAAMKGHILAQAELIGTYQKEGK